MTKQRSAHEKHALAGMLMLRKLGGAAHMPEHKLADYLIPLTERMSAANADEEGSTFKASFKSIDEAAMTIPQHTLEFTGETFDEPCRLLHENEVIAEGTAEQCVRTLSGLLDPYKEPFVMTVKGRVSVVRLVTAAQRAEGMTAILKRGH